MVDSAGTRMLGALKGALKEAGATLRLGAARAAVRDVLRAEKPREHVGPIDRRVSVADVVDERQRSTRSA
jgi:hypothetical protein